MNRALVASALVGWVGATLLLSSLRWFRRAGLAERLGPYGPGGMRADGGGGVLSVESFRAALAPVCTAAGERLARMLGVGEDLDVRLRRLHSAYDVPAFRVREAGASLAGFGVGGLAALAARPPGAIAALLIAGGPLLAFLICEQQIALASERRQRRTLLELPVIAEQLGTLLSAGYSLAAALERIAARGRGCCAQDIARVCARLRQGLTQAQALREWAETVQVGALDQLVALLAQSTETGEGARLLSEEARSIRREVQRQLVEQMQRKAQQVWIPVTVATLLPGVVLMAIPFLKALEGFVE